MTCDFCSKQITNQEIYKGDYIYLLYPRTPIFKRHFLFVPIKHIQFSHEMDNAEVEELFSLAQKVYLTLSKKENCVGYNFFTNNGSKAGQEVPHCHFHFFARYENEESSPFVLLSKAKKENLSAEEYKKNLNELRDLLRS